MSHPLRRLGAPLACALALALAACGSGGDDASDAGKRGYEDRPIGKGQVEIKASLLGDSKSAAAGADGRGYTKGYVPEGEIVADNGFRPEVDGFAFENYGNDVGPENLTAAEVEQLFGNQVCLSGSGEECRLVPAAEEWMANANESMAGGHCEGFSITSLKMYAGELRPEDYGAAQPIALEIQGNLPLQRRIAQDFVYQFLPPLVNERVKGTPTEVLETLIEALNSGEELYTLGIYKPDGSAGHAITPFAVEDKGDGEFNILVYDNNFPGETRAVAVETNADTWRYVGGTNPKELGQVYEGSADTPTFELDPTRPTLRQQPCPFCDGDTATKGAAKGAAAPKAARYTEITLSGDPRNHPRLLFTDDEGRRTGVIDGKLVTEIPDVEVVKTFAVQNWNGAPEPRYRLPEGADYTITVDGTELSKPTKADIDLIGNGLVIEIEEIEIAPGQKDEMALPGGYGITYQSNGKGEIAPNIYAGLVEDDAAYNFAASAVGIKAGSTISLLVEQEEKVVILDSTGSEGVLGGKGFFILQLTKADANGTISQWQNAGVRLNGAKEEKVGFEYGTSPRRGKPLPLVVLDKNSEATKTIQAKPTE